MIEVPARPDRDGIRAELSSARITARPRGGELSIGGILRGDAQAVAGLGAGMTAGFGSRPTIGKWHAIR